VTKREQASRIFNGLFKQHLKNRIKQKYKINFFPLEGGKAYLPYQIK